jgi:thioredoxin reductase (NADPH)
MAHVTVYGAPWCPETRRAKRVLGEARLDFEWVDVDDDPQAAAYVRRQSGGNLTIPVVVVDGSVLVAPSAAELAERLGLDATPRRFFDLIVVGAGPAGLTAALSAVREGISCLVVEQAVPGGQASMTPHLHGFPGFPDGTSGAVVRESLVGQAARHGVRILPDVPLSELRQVDGYVVAVTDDGQEFTARSAIAATGTVYRKLGVPGEDELRGEGIHSCASCDGPFYRKSEELLVVGGGDLAAEEALFLTSFTARVRVVESARELKASQLLQEKLRRHPKIEVYPSTDVVEFTMVEGKLAAASLRDRTTGYEFAFNPAAVFIYAGMTPNTEAFKGTVDLDEAGFIVTDQTLQTSMRGVFAAGDVRAGSTKQLGAAIGEGAAAVMMVRRYLQELGDLAPRPSA